MDTSARLRGGAEPAQDNLRPGTATQPAPASPKQSQARPAPAKEAPAVADPRLKSRRRLVWTSIAAFLVACFLMFLRFFFPRTLFEPSTRFRIGAPADFGLGVDERFKQANRIWVVRQPDKLFVVYAKCTHLGCTPNWVEPENKFKCPCHGSGYDIEGRNFEGPAPRPMDRAHIELDAEGQIVVDTSKLYPCVPGLPCEFDENPNSYLVVS
jgi:cytochrome b6-f complex iron-sulfur subunit